MVNLDLRAAHRSGIKVWILTRKVGLHEAIFVVAAFLVYFVIRGAVVNRAGQAIAAGEDVIDLERSLGFYWELTIQSWILGHYWLIKTMNWVYFWGHMPLVIIVAVWLYARHRRDYRLTRNAFLASGAIGVVIYALWPVAPPRLIPGAGFVDTMALFDRVSYNAQEARPFVNEFAAVPSLHFGWSLLLGFMVARVGRNWFCIFFGVTWPVAMFFAVVMTGNHFIFDTVAGSAVSFAGLGLAAGLERGREPAGVWLSQRWPLARGETSQARMEHHEVNR